MKIGLKSEDWIPPLLYYFNKFKYEKLDEFLSKLEYKFTGDWICGITPTKRVDTMNNILKKIEQAENEDDVLNDQKIFYIDKQEFETCISGNVYNKKNLSKY